MAKEWSGKKKVWHYLKKIHYTVQHGSPVMVWSCIGYNNTRKIHFNEGTIDANMFLKLLQDNLFESTRMLGIQVQLYFHRDNNPNLTASIVKEWLLYNEPNQLWSFLDKEVGTFKISNKNNLKRYLEMQWHSINT